MAKEAQLLDRTLSVTGSHTLPAQHPLPHSPGLAVHSVRTSCPQKHRHMPALPVSHALQAQQRAAMWSDLEQVSYTINGTKTHSGCCVSPSSFKDYTNLPSSAEEDSGCDTSGCCEESCEQEESGQPLLKGNNYQFC